MPRRPRPIRPWALPTARSAATGQAAVMDAALEQELVRAAVLEFDLDLSQLCYDLTSIAFCGDYDQADLIRFGYSRDHRPDRKQLELATTVTVAEKVPLDYRILAGNVADRTTPV